MSKRDNAVGAVLQAVQSCNLGPRGGITYDCAAIAARAIRVLPLGTFADETAEPERDADAQCEALRSTIMIFSPVPLPSRNPACIRYHGRRLSDMGVADLEAALLDVGAAYPDLCRKAIEAGRAVAKESKP